MATHASRDTTTGLTFETMVHAAKVNGIDVTKHKLYTYFKEHNIDWKAAISKQLLPDEAYFDPENKTLQIFEKKFQQTNGSCDEKPQTCGFKIWEFRKLGQLLGVSPENVTYTYILSQWFKDPRYKDMLDYIKATDGCDYIIAEV